jgi:hypothetical protein
VIEQYLEGRTIHDFRPAICASWAHAKPVSMRKSARFSRCFGRGEFARPVTPRESFSRLGFPHDYQEEDVARKTVLVCDNCSKEVEEARGATMRVTYSDARRGAKQADLCDDCAGKMPGQPAARRGRRPKSATPA